MKIAVISCWKYRDAWVPFFALFKKFWQDCPYEVVLLTDQYSGELAPDEMYVWLTRDHSWCKGLAEFSQSKWLNGEDCMLFQEDFLINAPVNQSLIEHALGQMKSRKAGMVRLYPCPGADEDYGDPHYGIVKKGSAYRISCQASIFRPDYLHAIASRCGLTPRDFELVGTEIAKSLPDEVLAFKRDSGPWPLSYYCSAISAGRWNPDALEFCRKNGITVDTSLRPIAEEVA